MARPHLLQILDANLNRLREGIRASEDVLRYTDGAAGVFARLKQLRLRAGSLETELRARLGRELIHARRLSGDLGKELTLPGELERNGPAGMLVANLNRAQEAARTIEEVVKLLPLPGYPGRYKRLRFALYRAESGGRLLLSRLAKERLLTDALRAFPLYLVVDQVNTVQQQPAELVARYYRAGGRVAQLRMKHLSCRRLYRLACQLRGDYGDLLLIINDRLDVALAADADGVHFGASDLPLTVPAKLQGDLLVGCSAGTPKSARRAVQAGASYVGVGAVFPTTTKSHMRVVGVEGLRAVAAAVPSPVIAIGGIKRHNFAQVMRAGAAGFAAISALSRPQDAARFYGAVRKWARHHDTRH